MRGPDAECLGERCSAWREPWSTCSSLPSALIFPLQNVPGECITPARPVCVGGRNFYSASLFGTLWERGSAAQAGRRWEADPSEGVCVLVLWLSHLSGQVGFGTQMLGYLYSCSCAIREAAAPGRPAPPPLGYTHVAQSIFQIKNSSYHAGGLLYSSLSEPGPTLLHPEGLSQKHLIVPSLREGSVSAVHGRPTLDSGAMVRKPGAWFRLIL